MSRLNLFELRLYRMLGVLPFRKFLFGVERLRHWKDGGKNKNYHMGKSSVGEAGRFEGYLLYNTFLHVVSLLLLAVFFVLKPIRYPGWHPWEIALYVLCLLNIWCIMLQRYNQLRIRQLRLRHSDLRAERVRRAAAKCISHLPEEYLPEQAEEDLRLVVRMQDGLAGGEVILLERKDADSLRRMSVLLGCAEKKKHGPQTAPDDGSDSIETLAECYGEHARPYSRIEKRVSGLQRLLSPGRRDRILSTCCVVTEDRETEEAFGALFPRDSLNAVEEKLLMIKAVMENAFTEDKSEGRSDHAGKTFS